MNDKDSCPSCHPVVISNLIIRDLGFDSISVENFLKENSAVALTDINQ